MSVVSTLLFVVGWGLAIGAGGRWLVPGPDPMPAWLTIAIGMAGSLAGAGAVVGAVGLPESAGEAYGLMWSTIAVSLVASALLVVAYRRFVQSRSILGREARKVPTSGIGIARIRERLGIDPPTDGVGRPDGDPAERLRQLDEVREFEPIANEELAAKGRVALTSTGRDDGPSGTARLLGAALLGPVRRLPRAFERRAAARRAGVLERRTSALISDLSSVPAAAGGIDGVDMSPTMRVAWELLAALRGSLLSLEERATRIVPAEIAGLIALWTQLYAFDAGTPTILAWVAWATLLGAILVLARLVMPSRLERFWDSLVPPEFVLAELRPLRPEDEAAIATHMATALHAQIDRLRRGFRLTVALSGIALVLTALAYMIDKS